MTTDDTKQIAEWRKLLAELKVRPFNEDSVGILYRITRALEEMACQP